MDQLTSLAELGLRIAVGTVFLVHGLQKRMFWTMQPSAQLPAGMIKVLRFLSIVEPLGALAMFAGFLTRPAAIGLSIIMFGAINLKAGQMKKGFTGDGGWELDFMVLAANVVLLLVGAGAWSLDRVLRI
ncbi:MAG TPA: DoxX family protein [Gemmatimonadales bacterium]|nr:DoxX family protein [Gemmatimonadales bacterium]